MWMGKSWGRCRRSGSGVARMKVEFNKEHSVAVSERASEFVGAGNTSQELVDQCRLGGPVSTYGD